jgi:hypothetical protein
MTWRAISGRPRLGSLSFSSGCGGGGLFVVLRMTLGLRRRRLVVAAQVEFESKFEAKMKSDLSYFSFKRFVQGGSGMGFIGSTCTA